MAIATPVESKGFTRIHLGGEHGVSVLLPEADAPPTRAFIGRETLRDECLAAWFALEGEPPLHFRLVGPPGVGKNEIVYHLAREVLKRPLYMLHGHGELTPEDVACTARITGDQRIEYVGSPLLAAMIRGGICFFDEIGKVPGRSLSLLASVLDDRRTLTSVLAGFTVRAHPDFLFCAAMNDDDEATHGLPGYIDERLRPSLRLEPPPLEETLVIVRAGAPRAEQALFEAFRRWAHGSGDESRPLSPREALTAVRYADRLQRAEPPQALTPRRADELMRRAVRATTRAAPR
jgi:MoxR-like ATPase